MKTLAEVKQCAQQYRTSGLPNGRPENIDKYPFEKIVSDIQKDEEIIIAFPAGGGSVGRTALQSIAVAITNKRLIVCGKPNSLMGMFMEPGLRSVKLDKVNSVGVYGMSVRIDTLGDEDCMFANYKPEIRDTISKNIQSILNYFYPSTNNQNVVPQKSAAEQIREFKALFDEGIITEDEFTAKKKALLQSV